MRQHPGKWRTLGLFTGTSVIAAALALGAAIAAESSGVWLIQSNPPGADRDRHKAIAIKTARHAKTPIIPGPVRIVGSGRSSGVHAEVRESIGVALRERGFGVESDEGAERTPNLVLSFDFGTKRLEYDKISTVYDARIHGQRFRFELDEPPISRQGKVLLFLHYFHAELTDSSANRRKRVKWDGLSVLGDVLNRDPALSDAQVLHVIHVLAEKVMTRFPTDWRAVDVMDTGYSSDRTLVPRMWIGEPLEALLRTCRADFDVAFSPYRNGGRVVEFFHTRRRSGYVPPAEINQRRHGPTGPTGQDFDAGIAGTAAGTRVSWKAKEVVARFWVDDTGTVFRSWIDEDEAEACFFQHNYDDSE